jgi:hypothetical protein
MERTTFTIPQDLHVRLRRLAAERGVSMATVVRDAIEEKLATSHPRPRSLGAGSSGLRDVARRAADERPEPRSWR